MKKNENMHYICFIAKLFILLLVILECYKYLMKWLWCNIQWSHSHKSYIIAYFERRNVYATGVDCINSYSHFSSFRQPYYSTHLVPTDKKVWEIMWNKCKQILELSNCWITKMIIFINLDLISKRFKQISKRIP